MASPTLTQVPSVRTPAWTHEGDRGLGVGFVAPHSVRFSGLLRVLERHSRLRLRFDESLSYAVASATLRLGLQFTHGMVWAHGLPENLSKVLKGRLPLAAHDRPAGRGRARPAPDRCPGVVDGGSPGNRVPADHSDRGRHRGLVAAGAGEAGHVPYAECVAALTWGDGSRTLLSRDSFRLHIRPADWKDGAEIAKALEQGLPSDVLMPAGPRPNPDPEVLSADSGPLTKAAKRPRRVDWTQALVTLITGLVMLGIYLTLRAITAGHWRCRDESRCPMAAARTSGRAPAGRRRSAGGQELRSAFPEASRRG